MEKRTEMTRARGIGRLTVYGAAGFGIGGAIGGAIWVAFEAPQVGFPVMGALGGASLSLGLKDWKRITIVALACAVGFDFGFLLSSFILLALWEPAFGQGLFMGGVGGAIGGFSLGLGMKRWRTSWLLALMGAIGFGIAAQGFWNVPRGMEPQVLWGAITLAVWGVVGGAALGATSGWLEKRRAQKDNVVDSVEKN